MENNHSDSDFSKIFDKRFQEYKSKRIGIYGLGENARIIIENVSGYHFVCLVAKDNIGENKYGLTIRSLDQALDDVDVIIIAASFAATNIIRARICPSVPNNIIVLNLYGEVLNSDVTNSYDDYWNMTYEQLCAEIDQYDVISFDVFDTLIMRDVLKPTDIFEEIGQKNNIAEFQEVRIGAEKKARELKKEPNLQEIYEELAARTGYKNDIIARLIDSEIETEQDHCIARDTVIAAYRYALNNGKKIFFTSDMYLSKDVIKKLLSKCGIDEGYELLVSNEFGTSKLSGELFDLLVNKADGKRILHIGDDLKVDKQNAEKKGVDSFLIRSAYDMLSASDYATLFDYLENENDKDYLGYYISKALNDPFAMNGSKGKIPIKTEKDISFLLYPVTKLLLDFIIDNAHDYDCLLFPSRDGWFLYQLYCQYNNDHAKEKLPIAKYVYSSRMGLSRAALSDIDNFIVLLNKLFVDYSLNCKRYFGNQFGIEISDEFNYSSGELIQKYGKEGFTSKLLALLDNGLLQNKKDRDAYIAYLQNSGIYGYQRPALIDIVSYGTQVYCLSELLGAKVDMVALGSTSIPNAYLDEDSARTIYGNVNKVVNGAVFSVSDMSVLHLLLEMFYSSADGQFLRMSENGNPIFANGTEYNKELLINVQKGILEIYSDLAKMGEQHRRYSKEFAYAMLRALRSQYSHIDSELSQKFAFSDPYDGGLKSVNLSDVL